MSLCQCRIWACQHQLPWVFESTTCSHSTSAHVLRHNTFHSLNKQADLTWKVEELREHLSFIYLRLPADVAYRIFLPVAFLVAFIPTTISRYLKNQHPNGSPCYASHPKSLWRWLKTRLPVFWRVGPVTTSTRKNTAANSEPKGDGRQGWSTCTTTRERTACQRKMQRTKYSGHHLNKEGSPARNAEKSPATEH